MRSIDVVDMGESGVASTREPPCAAQILPGAGARRGGPSWVPAGGFERCRARLSVVGAEGLEPPTYAL